jgi:hypothetical protein
MSGWGRGKFLIGPRSDCHELIVAWFEYTFAGALHHTRENSMCFIPSLRELCEGFG